MRHAGTVTGSTSTTNCATGFASADNNDTFGRIGTRSNGPPALLVDLHDAHDSDGRLRETYERAIDHWHDPRSTRRGTHTKIRVWAYSPAHPHHPHHLLVLGTKSQGRDDREDQPSSRVSPRRRQGSRRRGAARRVKASAHHIDAPYADVPKSRRQARKPIY